MKEQVTALDNLIEPIVESLGFEYVGCEYRPQGYKSLLRIYIEGAKGVTIDDCAQVSRQVGSVLDVENPIHGEYQLEVSSPGLERPLFSLEHFQRFIGQIVRVKLHSLIDGRRNFMGKIDKIDEGMIILIDDKDEEQSLPYTEIDKANLVVEFDDARQKQ